MAFNGSKSPVDVGSRAGALGLIAVALQTNDGPYAAAAECGPRTHPAASAAEVKARPAECSDNGALI